MTLGEYSTAFPECLHEIGGVADGPARSFSSLVGILESRALALLGCRCYLKGLSWSRTSVGSCG